MDRREFEALQCDLRAAIGARVPLELTDARGYRGGSLSVTRQLEAVNSMSPSGDSDHSGTAGARVRATLRVYAATKSSMIILDALSGRLVAQREITRLVVASMTYLTLVCMLAVATMTWLDINVIPVFAASLADTGYSAQSQPDVPVGGPFWLSNIRLLFAALSVLGVIVLLLGGHRIVGALLGGHRYVQMRTRSLAAAVARRLIVARVAQSEAIETGCRLAATDSQSSRWLADSASGMSVVEVESFLSSTESFYRRMADQRISRLRWVIPMLLVSLVGGPLLVIYGAAIFEPIIRLLLELSVPSGIE